MVVTEVWEGESELTTTVDRMDRINSDAICPSGAVGLCTFRPNLIVD